MANNSQVTKTGNLSFKVNKEVVSHLSIGLYRNFGRAIKELISNAYDAGATELKIKLDLKNSEIIVRDNGRGMDIKEIEQRFLSIGYTTPSSDKVDELGRKRIGTFGIGCLSVFPYCNKLQVITKKKDSSEISELNINTEGFFKGLPSEIEKEKIPYKIHKSDLPKDKGETIISLKGIKPHLVKELKQVGSSGRATIDKYSGYQKFKWTLSQYSPLMFPEGSKLLKDFFDESNKKPMRLWLDGTELFRNVPEKVKLLEKGEQKLGGISFKYALLTPMKPVEPEEARGIQVRLRDTAIGLPRDFDVRKLGKVLGKLNYLCGEVHVTDGLDGALMIDRDSFSYTEDVAELHDFFRKKLTRWNETLEQWALQDKAIYESLIGIDGEEAISKQLKKANILRFSRERLRLPKHPIVKGKKKEVSSPSITIKKALEGKKDYKVVAVKGESKSKTPVEIKPDKKEILVYEEHPTFTESIELEKRKYKVLYEEWNPKQTAYSICKLDERQKKVVFNSAHPLFKSKISNEVVKKLSLGVLLILKDTKGQEKLIKRMNELLETAFGG